MKRPSISVDCYCIQSIKVELIYAFYFLVVVIIKIGIENIVINQYVTEEDLPQDFTTNQPPPHNLEEIGTFPMWINLL